MSADIEGLVQGLALAVTTLKQTLEQHQIEQIEADLKAVQTAMDAIHAYPDGTDGLVAALNLLPAEPSKHLRNRLEQAKAEHALCGELIKLALQRNAALQAYTAQNDPAATYSAEGGVSMGERGQLLGKI